MINAFVINGNRSINFRKENFVERTFILYFKHNPYWCIFDAQSTGTCFVILFADAKGTNYVLDTSIKLNSLIKFGTFIRLFENVNRERQRKFEKNLPTCIPCVRSQNQTYTINVYIKVLYFWRRFSNYEVCKLRIGTLLFE